MSNSRQILGQVASGVSLQASRAKASADSPTVAIEQPNLSFPGRRIRAGRDPGRILKNAKTTKVKADDRTRLSSTGIDSDGYMDYRGVEMDDIDSGWEETIPADKMSLTSAGVDSDGFMDYRGVEVDDMNHDWDKIIPADKLDEIKSEEEGKQHGPYVTKVAAEGVSRRALKTIRQMKFERDFLSLKNLDKEQQNGATDKKTFFRDHELSLTSSPEGGHSCSPPESNGSLPLHSSPDTLLGCRLLNTHYTISQDHTSGQEAHEDYLLASFGKKTTDGHAFYIPRQAQVVAASAEFVGKFDKP